MSWAAFPVHVDATSGMSMQDYFAAQVYVGLLAMAANPQALEAFCSNAADANQSMNDWLGAEAYRKAASLLDARRAAPRWEAKP